MIGEIGNIYKNKIMITGNEPAMPCREDITYVGLTIKQYFAASALQGLLSNSGLVDYVNEFSYKKNKRKQISGVYVNIAMQLADELIEKINNY